MYFHYSANSDGENNLTLTDYYQHFRSIFGAIAALISTIPLFSVLLRDSVGKYIFPPLGGAETLGGVVTFILIVMTTFVVFFMKDAVFIQSRGKRNIRLFVLFGVIVLGLLSYVALSTSFVCTVPVPDSPTMISIGFEQTEFARANFQDYDPCKMLKERGPYESEVRRLWTMRSTIVVRCALLLSYLSCLLGAVGLTSLAVLFDAYGPAPNP